MAIPFTRPPEWPPVKAGRFAATIETDSAAGCSIALLGLPDDTGVRLNGGRAGAADGPRAFRAALASFGTTWDLDADREIDVRVFDAGDVEPVAGGTEAALAETHARVEAAARALHEHGCVTVGIGGGHDLALPCIAAWAKHHGEAVGGINLDAHLDVREKVGSGMPFRRLITGGHVDPRAFVELGLGRFANDRARHRVGARPGGDDDRGRRRARVGLLAAGAVRPGAATGRRLRQHRPRRDRRRLRARRQRAQPAGPGRRPRRAPRRSGGRRRARRPLRHHGALPGARSRGAHGARRGAAVSVVRRRLAQAAGL